jgi:hypothetical protein
MAERAADETFGVSVIYQMIDELRHEVLRLADISYNDGELQNKHKRLVGQLHELIRTLSLMLRNPDSYPLAVAFDIVAEIDELSREFPELPGAKNDDLSSSLAEIVLFWGDVGNTAVSGARRSPVPNNVRWLPRSPGC